MIEELKVVAEMIAGLSTDAQEAFVTYLAILLFRSLMTHTLFGFLLFAAYKTIHKIISVTSIGAHVAHKMDYTLPLLDREVREIRRKIDTLEV